MYIMKLFKVIIFLIINFLIIFSIINFFFISLIFIYWMILFILLCWMIEFINRFFLFLLDFLFLEYFPFIFEYFFNLFGIYYVLYHRYKCRNDLIFPPRALYDIILLHLILIIIFFRAKPGIIAPSNILILYIAFYVIDYYFYWYLRWRGYHRNFYYFFFSYFCKE